MNDWKLADCGDGTVDLILGDTKLNLGPRDEALVRFADFFGDDGVSLPPEGFVAPEVMR